MSIGITECTVSAWNVACLLKDPCVSLIKEQSDERNIVTTECRMDIHVRRMANISDMNVQATGIAAMD